MNPTIPIEVIAQPMTWIYGRGYLFVQPMAHRANKQASLFFQFPEVEE